jgi:hypothetical protein
MSINLSDLKQLLADFDERDEEIGIMRNKISRLTKERDAALERAEAEHHRYLTEREVNVALGEERDGMRTVVEAAERWADNTWPSHRAINGEILDAVTAYRKAKP